MSNRDRAIVNYMNKKPWAIMPEALETIQEIVCNHMDGISVKLSPADSYTTEMFVEDGVAVIPIHGTVAKKLYGLEALSGGETTIDWGRKINEALEDPNVTGIVLDIDSPGGTVDGTKELADFIFNSRGKKPIVAYANGTMASAAYWLGSAAEKIVAYDTSQVGSIGVIISHRDFSKAEEAAGIKTTHIYAGKYKAMGSPYEPLNEESREYIQGKVDYYYTMFVDAVAQHRRTDSKTVIEKMAEGRVFIGSQAQEVGLVDVIGNLATAINLAKEGGTNVTVKEMIDKHGATAILSELVASHSAELPAQVVSAFAEANKPVLEIPAEIRATIDAMQARINQLDQEKAEALEEKARIEQETALKEHKAAVINKLTAIGLQDDEIMVSLGMKLDASEFDAIVDKISIYQGSTKAIAKELFTETPNAVSESKEEVYADFDQAVAGIIKKNGVDVDEAIKIAVKEYPELYEARTQVKGGN